MFAAFLLHNRAQALQWMNNMQRIAQIKSWSGSCLVCQFSSGISTGSLQFGREVKTHPIWQEFISSSSSLFCWAAQSKYDDRRVNIFQLETIFPKIWSKLVNPMMKHSLQYLSLFAESRSVVRQYNSIYSPKLINCWFGWYWSLTMMFACPEHNRGWYDQVQYQRHCCTLGVTGSQ